MAGWEELWREGVGRVKGALARLDEQARRELECLCLSLVARKEAMQELVGRVDASSHCAGCGGACCVTGKYHFAAVDLVPYLVTGRELFEPDFRNGLCPYLAPDGCLMPPGYRPFNCITFNCERIEDQLAREEVELFYSYERELRQTYARLRAALPAGAGDGALLKD